MCQVGLGNKCITFYLLCVNEIIIIEIGFTHNYETSDIQRRIRADNHAVLKTVKIWTGRSWVLPKHLLKMRRSNYPDNCLIIDINSMDSMTTMLKEGTLQIFFRFHRIAGFNVELNLEDRERVVHRADKSGRLAYSGPLMRWETKNHYHCLDSFVPGVAYFESLDN